MHEKESGDLLKTRYRRAYVYVKTETGGSLIGAIGAGGMQGGSVMPGQFTEGYNKASKNGLMNHKSWKDEFECAGATDTHES